MINYKRLLAKSLIATKSRIFSFVLKRDLAKKNDLRIPGTIINVLSPF